MDGGHGFRHLLFEALPYCQAVRNQSGARHIWQLGGVSASDRQYPRLSNGSAIADGSRLSETVLNNDELYP
jgi:hypothetical protein